MKHSKEKNPQQKNTRKLIWKTIVLSVLASAALAWGVNALRNRPLTDMSHSISVDAASLEDDSSENEEEEVYEVTQTTPDFIQSIYSDSVDFTYGHFVNAAVYDGSFRSELTENGKVIYDGFVENYVNQKQNVPFTVEFSNAITFDISSYNEILDRIMDDEALAEINDMALSASAAFYFDHPEVFWIRSFNYTISYTPDGDIGDLDSITVNSSAAYSNAYNDLTAVQNGIATAVNTIRSNRASASRYDTLKAIDAYICENAAYDWNAADNYAAYGCAYTAAPLFGGGTRGKTFVCEGYSKSFKILCGEFGIPCTLVIGKGMTTASSGGAHMWNYVQMEDGNWYGVDVTWNDRGSFSSGSYFLVGSNTKMTSSMTFGQNHLPTDQIMTEDTVYPLAYPDLSVEAYTPAAADPADISLVTLGASIRVSAPYGIRFGIQLAKDDAYQAADIVEYGTLIIASNTLGSSELTLDTDNIRRIKADNIYSEDNTQITYTGVLVNIPGSFFNSNVKGRGYLIYRDSQGNEQVIYSETVEKSFYGVAQSAYASYSQISNPNSEQKQVIVRLKDILSK